MMTQEHSTTVLVTGATGFVALHCILRLLREGYSVRGTVRSLDREKRVRDALRKHTDATNRLSFVAADLSRDGGWMEAVSGCTYVLHVASPVPTSAPKHEDEVIAPARDGTMRVLRAAAATGVKRVVLTSSTSAVLYGHARDGSKHYDERDWTILSDDVGPYEKSKTIAERAAWEYVQTLPEDQRFELVAVNPGVVLGPLLDSDYSVSGEVVRKLLTGELPGCPNLGWAAVDVRDTAAAHVLAMTHPDAPGQRFIIANEHTPMAEIARILANHFGPRGYRVPQRRIPDLILKLVALWDKTAALTVHELGKRQDVSSERARKVLGWTSRSLDEMVIDMAESMIRLDVIPGPKKSGRLAADKRTTPA
jgi:dihydroflavonol-4-reductase